MNMHSAMPFCLLTCLLVPVPLVLAAEIHTAEEKQNTKTTPAVEATSQEKQRTRGNPILPVYAPPRRGIPLTRVGASARGRHDSMPVVVVITPEHTGLTGTPQPDLYWYLSKATRTRFQFAIVNEVQVEPIMDISSNGDLPAGFNHIDLRAHDITLEPGIVYQWSVALVQDPVKRADDIISSGQIEYAEIPAALHAQLENATPDEAVRALAEAGYWYDTFARLSQMITAEPGNTTLQEERAALLEQVGLAGLTGNQAAGSDTRNAE
jgi:hypothetical protein